MEEEESTLWVSEILVMLYFLTWKIIFVYNKLFNQIYLLCRLTRTHIYIIFHNLKIKM